MATIATLRRIQPSTLSKLLLSPDHDPNKIAIIDVRDDDYIGGHIKGAQNFPSHQLDATLPTLVRQLEDKPIVVFHCALSQQRGPGAALRYIRERERLLASKQRKREKQQRQLAASGAGEEEQQQQEEKEKEVEQTVYVLDRGFVGWQEVYGADVRLTEGYRKELWEDGYWA